MNKQNWPKLLVRLPDDAKHFLELETHKNGSSLNSEVIRCIRQRMDELANSSNASTAKH